MQRAQLDAARQQATLHNQSLPEPIPGSFRFAGVPTPGPQATAPFPSAESRGTTQPQANVSNAPLAPLFSYISHGMDTLLQSIQRSQAASQEVVMAEVATIRQELKASHAQAADGGNRAVNGGNPSTLSDSDSCPFPPKKKRSMNRRHFIPSDPSDPENKIDIQQHVEFSVCCDVNYVFSLVLTFMASEMHPPSCSLSPPHPRLQISEHHQVCSQ